MLFRTHLAIGVFTGFVAFFAMGNSILAFFAATFASLLPDIDSTSSFMGNRFWLRPMQWIIKHRGIFHSLTLCVFLSWIVALYYPPVAFAFFIGYASHLLLDSFTIEGVVPFWPLSYKTEGVITTGGKIDSGIFWISCLCCGLFLIAKLFG